MWFLEPEPLYASFRTKVWRTPWLVSIKARLPSKSRVKRGQPSDHARSHKAGGLCSKKRQELSKTPRTCKTSHANFLRMAQFGVNESPNRERMRMAGIERVSTITIAVVD